MKIIIAGSRGVDDYYALSSIVGRIRNKYDISEVISGTAGGVDRLGERYAEEEGLKLTRMPADWETHGKKAGPLRNAEMLEVADVVFVLWDGYSNGSKHMADISKSSGKPTFLYNIRTRRGSKYNAE